MHRVVSRRLYLSCALDPPSHTAPASAVLQDSTHVKPVIHMLDWINQTHGHVPKADVP